jgi:hypothetical protein
MSDRTRGSVRTTTRTTDAAKPGTPPAPEAPATGQGAVQTVSTTQSIPTGNNRAVQAKAPAGQGAGKPAQATVQAPAEAPVQAPVQSPTQAPASAPGQAPAPAQVPAAAATATSAGTIAAGRGSKAAAKAGAPTSAPAAARKPTGSGRGPRRARLQLRHIDTWSAFKISFVLSIALFFIWMVAVGVLYGVLGGLGVFTTLNELFGQLGSASGTGGGGADVITPGIVFGAAAVIGAVNIILLTALATVATFIYNLCSDLVGGLEVTLSERD